MPLIAATRGFLQYSRLLNTSFKLCPDGFPPNSEISAPAIKALPFPVSTTPTTLSSASALAIPSYSPFLTPSLNGLTGGLSTVKSATLSTTS